MNTNTRKVVLLDHVPNNTSSADIIREFKTSGKQSAIVDEVSLNITVYALYMKLRNYIRRHKIDVKVKMEENKVVLHYG